MWGWMSFQCVDVGLGRRYIYSNVFVMGHNIQDALYMCAYVVLYE